MAVHRVAGFVREREQIVQHGRLVVHHDVRIGFKTAAAKGAALLALIGIAIAPTTV